MNALESVHLSAEEELHFKGYVSADNIDDLINDNIDDLINDNIDDLINEEGNGFEKYANLSREVFKILKQLETHTASCAIKVTEENSWIYEEIKTITNHLRNTLNA